MEVRVMIESRYMNEQKENEAKGLLLQKYNVNGNYIDGAYPKWELSGEKENVKKAINEHWLFHGFIAPNEVKDENTMQILGFEM